MSRWKWIVLLLPLVIVTANVATYCLIAPEPEVHEALNSEFGPVEVFTALSFLAIGVVSILLWRRLGQTQAESISSDQDGHAGAFPTWVRAWYLVVAAGGFLMFFEEISWGQHYLGWAAPSWFAEYNKQSETNLHNLFDDLGGSLSRRIAEIGLPIWAVLVPAFLLMFKNSYRRPKWEYYIMPRWELMSWVLVAFMCRPTKSWIGDHSYRTFPRSFSELEELLWAGALLVYIVLMYKRLLTKLAESEHPRPTDYPFDGTRRAHADTGGEPAV